SGFGGAALSRSTVGEGIERVVDTYPHWFAPEFEALSKDPEALPVDQHQLLALLAPTPVFLGNGRRDVWSDPNSTYRAAESASRIYQLYGRRGLSQQGL
ncbi:MAG: alpha/beta hydrolase, partial [Pseudomonadota bacterium]